MLILILHVFLLMLGSSTGMDRPFFRSNLMKSKRGVIESSNIIPQAYMHYKLQPIIQNVQTIQNTMRVPYRSTKINSQESPFIISRNSPIYRDTFKQSPFASLSLAGHLPEAQIDKQLSSHPEDLFTISAGYNIMSDNSAKQFKQAGSSLQAPLYKTGYTSSGRPEGQDSRDFHLPIINAGMSQKFAASLPNVNNQPLSPTAAIHQLNFASRSPKANNVQFSTPFLSPFANFHEKMIPISTLPNKQQYSQHKSVAAGNYPSTGDGLSMINYQSLQGQPHLHFGQGNILHTQGGSENQRQSEKIYSDVEIIDKNQPPPPSRNDNDDDDDAEGDIPHEKQYRIRLEMDADDKYKSAKHFKTSPTQGDFKPSTSFPFKQYDETFGRYTSQSRDEQERQKPFIKYNVHSSSKNGNENQPSERYRLSETPSNLYYAMQGEGEENDDEYNYETQTPEKSFNDGEQFKYTDKDFGEDYQISKGNDVLKEKHVLPMMEPETDEYNTRPLNRSRGNYDNEDSTNDRD